jgi:hypothetical protein
MCPHTATLCVRILLYVSSYYYICVLILLYMCRHTAGTQVRCFSVPGVPADAVPFVNIEAPGHVTRTAISVCPHTTMYMCPRICVLIMLYTCVRILLYVSAYYCICVRILLYVSSHCSMYPHTMRISKLVDMFDRSRDFT